jgi:uncharacterized alkaline shock family protein YloU
MIRAATLGSYGVTGFAASLPERVLAALGVGHPGIRVRMAGDLEVELDLTVAYGVPVAEVARQVDSAVRYSLRRGLDREVTHLTIHVEGLAYHPGGLPPASSTSTPLRTPEHGPEPPADAPAAAEGR